MFNISDYKNNSIRLQEIDKIYKYLLENYFGNCQISNDFKVNQKDGYIVYDILLNNVGYKLYKSVVNSFFLIPDNFNGFNK